MMASSPGNQSQLLLELNITWQRLIIDRANARQGTTHRCELDNLYYRILPIIVAIAEAVDDSEIDRLVQVVNHLLKQREEINE